ncbi:MAG: cystathionine beta-lyase [Alphaproteobacteria bacterium]
MKKDTRLVSTGRGDKAAPGMVNVPVYHASTIVFDTVAELNEAISGRDEHVLYYGRRGTPTQWALMDALTELDGGAGCALYGSGLAAITGALLAFVEAGDHVLMADTVYGPSRIFCDHGLKKLGVETTYYDPMIGAGIADLMRDNTKLVFTESPGSLTFEVQDTAAIAAAAKAHGAWVFADNTWATPLFFRPLDHGVDVAIQALTKYVVGHSDVMMGAAVANERAWKRLRLGGFMHGHCAAPDDTYLALRGLRTLGVRLERHQENALKVAHWLDGRPEVHQVLHPAFPDTPGHDFWKRDFSGATGLFSIVLKEGTDDAVAALLDGLDHFKLGFSWGGYESLAIPSDPAQGRTATEWSAPGPLIRFHIGLEDPEDLIADLDEGFRRFAAAL